MGNLGAIKQAMRLENRRVFLPVPVPFWRRVRLSLLFFGLFCFLSGFFVGRADAAGGSLQYIVECNVIGTSGDSTAPCVTVGANRYGPSMVQAYVIDPAYQVGYEDWIANQLAVDSLVASKTNIDWLVANQAAIQNTLNNQSTLTAQSFDPVTAGQFFGWGFTGLMLVGVAAWGLGSLLGFTDRVLNT